MGMTRKERTHSLPRFFLIFGLISALSLFFPVPAIPEENSNAVGDALGVGFDETTVLDITLEEAYEIGGVATDDDGDKISPATISPSQYQTLMNYAMQYKGWKYVWAGKYPSNGGFDCSGLVTWCYDQALGATMDGMMTNAERIYTDFCDYVSPSQAKPGDLVFWRGTYGSDVNYISHVGIYCGGNLCYAAGNPIGFYRIDNLRNIHGGRAAYFFGSLREVAYTGMGEPDGVIMHRLYNPYTSEHFYTANTGERDWLTQSHGWTNEGVGWIAPSNGEPVYRLYNEGLGDHHYTTSKSEKEWLVRSQGWTDEGIGWYSGGTMPVYRQYNGGLKKGQHNYTTSKSENDWLCANHGWQAEGIGWYGI